MSGSSPPKTGKSYPPRRPSFSFEGLKERVLRRGKRRPLSLEEDLPSIPKAAKIDEPNSSPVSAFFSSTDSDLSGDQSLLDMAPSPSPAPKAEAEAELAKAILATPALIPSPARSPPGRAEVPASSTPLRGVGRPREKRPPRPRPTAPAPAFVDHPVVLQDTPGGPVCLAKLGPWQRTQLIEDAVGTVRSVRPLPSGKWLVGCSSLQQQSKLARLDALPGGVAITASCPVPSVEGVVEPIPIEENALSLLKKRPSGRRP